MKSIHQENHGLDYMKNENNSLPDGWEIKKLGDVIEIRNGKNQKEVLSETGQYPIYGSGGNIMGYATDYICEAGTTIIGRKGNISKPLFIDEKFWNVDTAFGLYPKKDLPKRFVYYTCLNIDFGSMNRGTTIPSLVKTELLQIPIQIPKSLPEQQRIVAILDEAFEAIAQAKSNAEQNLQNAKELFESYLQGVFENKGEDWEEKTLNEITDVKDGTHDSPKYIIEGIPFVTQKNIKLDGLSFTDTKFITKIDHEKFYKRSNVAFGDILISMIGANRGMAAIVDDKRIFSIKNVGLIKSSNNINNHFLLYYLKSPLAMKYVLYMSNGGAQEFVGLTALRSFPIPFPPLETQQTIVAKLDALSAETKKLEAIYQQKINDLEELKKSVLEKAFSGQLGSRIKQI